MEPGTTDVPDTTDVLSIDVGRKNLALCILCPGPEPKDDRIVKWTVTACDPTPRGIATALKAFGPYSGRVVVERQPARNPTMTRLQHYIEMYYAMHDVPVTVFDPKHKLAYAAATCWFPKDVAKWSYYTRKKVSVQTTAAFLKDTGSDMTEVFDGSKKKDDLADSFLQAAAFCRLSVRTAPVSKNTGPKPRRPSVKQIESGKYTKPNIAWFLKGCPDEATKRHVIMSNTKLHDSIVTQYGSIDVVLKT